MDFSAAQKIYTSIEGSRVDDLKQDLILSASRYAQIRAEWYFADPEERQNMDLRRTATHNSFIASCNALSRAMSKNGESNGWRADLGNDRVTIGDFACYVHLFLGLAAR